MDNEFGISLDDAISELQLNVEEAINFMHQEFEEKWAVAERYYAGQCDLPTEDGRSQVIKTEVRDSIDAVMPNLLRIFYQARTPVEYIPSKIQHAEFIDQQGLYVNQLFKQCGGYGMLQDAALNALKLKIGPMKAWWESDPMPRYMKHTGLTTDEVEKLKEQPDVEVLEVEENPQLGEDGLYDVEARQYFPYGKIICESFMPYEFFVSRNATDLEDAKVHGHYREMTVGDAIDMGLPEDTNWLKMIDTDPEQQRASDSSLARRGYSAHEDEMSSADLLQQNITIAETYCKFDLEGDGIQRRYCFLLGGPGFDYIDHYEIEDYCISLACAYKQPSTVVGRSLAERIIEKQDSETSILRAIDDNAHMSNNPRIAADPNSADFRDIMNNAIGAPVKTRGAPALQTIDIPFTGGQLIPYLQYMEQDTENRVGATKAATGLDPDALQSTDKEAVRNTIATAQGQTELIARNIVETGLIPLFSKLLRLAQRHMDRNQIIRMTGRLVPVDHTIFDPDLAAEANVGLGTASHEQKLMTLGQVYTIQKETLAEMGMDNPVTSLSQLYNTIEDITQLGGLRDPGRYFNVVTPEIEAQLAAGRQEDEAAAQQAMLEQQPMDPGKAMLESETIKAQASVNNKQIDAQLRTRELDIMERKNIDQDDRARDKLVQDRVIELRKLAANDLSAPITQEQEANDDRGNTGRTGTTGGS